MNELITRSTDNAYGLSKYFIYKYFLQLSRVDF